MNSLKICAWAVGVVMAVAGCGGGGGGSGGGDPDLFQNGFVDDRPPQTGATAVYDNAERQAAWQMINEIRRRVGLGDFFQSAQLDEAAQAHAAYMTRNNRRDVIEEPGTPLFAAVTPGARVLGVGYPADFILETTASTSADLNGQQLVDLMMGAPYHRMRILLYSPSEIGVGYDAGVPSETTPRSLVVDVGYRPGNSQGAPNTRAVVWPADGAEGVPTSGCCEQPNPVPPLLQWGYPVSVQTHERKELKVDSFTLRNAAGTEVATRLLSYNQDVNLRDDFAARYVAFLMPLLPLADGATYTARFVGSINGAAYEKTWSFTTRP